MTTTEPLDDRSLSLSREVAAPRDLVWTVLTDPAHLAKWWGPTGFRTETYEHDLRVGGLWRFTMHGPDGHPYLNHAVFDAIEAPHRLVLRYVEAPGTEPAIHVTTITLDALGPKRTRITLALRFPTAEYRALVVEKYGAVQGGHQTLARLAALLEGEPDAAFEVRRVLNAPQRLVWDAWTDEAHLHRWFHPEVWSIFESHLDLRVGGTFFYGFRGPDFPDAWGLWQFTAVEAPQRLAFLLSFADAHRNVVASPFGGPWPARIATTVTIERHAGLAGGTVLTLRSTPFEATDAEIAAFREIGPSMEEGWGQTLDNLAAFLA